MPEWLVCKFCIYLEEHKWSKGLACPRLVLGTFQGGSSPVENSEVPQALLGKEGDWGAWLLSFGARSGAQPC